MAAKAVIKVKLRKVEQIIDRVLGPLGFKKRNFVWRRMMKEVLQQFALVSDQLMASYHVDWGLNVISFSENPNPLQRRLHVRWLPMHMIKTRKRRIRVAEALDFASPVSDAQRAKLVTEVLKKDVLPCFDAFQSKAEVRRMARNWKYPLRAQMLFNLPDDWWPPEDEQK